MVCVLSYKQHDNGDPINFAVSVDRQVAQALIEEIRNEVTRVHAKVTDSYFMIRYSGQSNRWVAQSSYKRFDEKLIETSLPVKLGIFYLYVPPILNVEEFDLTGYD